MGTQRDSAASAGSGVDGLHGLVHALQTLGDAASSATTAGGDIRLHVIACRAHHLAVRVADQAGIALSASGEVAGARDLHEAAQALRHHVVSLAGGRPGIRPVLGQARSLVLLADAVQR